MYIEEEREVRRKIMPNYGSIRSFDTIEWRIGTVRFIYDLGSDTFSWQRKVPLRSHAIVCPDTIEKCYHSTESANFTSCLQFPHAIPGNFFFRGRPATKRILARKGGKVVAYFRTLDCLCTGHLECELDGQCRPDIEDYRSYLKLAETYDARVPVAGESREPLVKQVSWDRVRETAKLVAIKWDGVRRVVELDLGCAYAGIRYCVEIFSDVGVVVDVCDSSIDPTDRVEHLLRLPADRVWSRHGFLFRDL
jgi:hypothetical protein